MAKLTAKRVRKLMDHNPETGTLTWKARPGVPRQWNTRYAVRPRPNPRRRLIIAQVAAVSSRQSSASAKPIERFSAARGAHSPPSEGAHAVGGASRN